MDYPARSREEERDADHTSNNATAPGIGRAPLPGFFVVLQS